MPRVGLLDYPTQPIISTVNMEDNMKNLRLVDSRSEVGYMVDSRSEVGLLDELKMTNSCCRYKLSSGIYLHHNEYYALNLYG